MLKLAFCAVLLWSAPLLAQTGTIKGIVPDESGGFVPGAKLTLTAASGTTTNAISSAGGSYSFGDVPLGAYTLNASAPELMRRQSG